MTSSSKNTTRNFEVYDVLRQWRTRAVTIMLYIIVVLALPAYVGSVIQWGKLGNWLSISLVTVVYLSIVVVTVFRKLKYRLRAAIFLSAGYLMAAVNLASTGLASSGRIYLVVMPIIAFILVGTRAGWITTILSALVYAVFCILLYAGALHGSLVAMPDPLDISNWINSGITFIMLLVLVIVLLARMHLFLLNTLRSERKLSHELEKTYDKTLEGWARALELRDIETAGHCHRVCEITKRLAGRISVTNGDMIEMYRGSLLHDIGKMGIPDSILLKPGKLTSEEFRQMQEHTIYAYDLLVEIPYLTKALDIPYCHHEKWDGSGYPRGLKEKNIPLSARIFSVVDVYDALISDRPYRPAWTEEKALAYIREKSGTEFDPHVVDVFIQLINEEIESLSPA
jgi:hypothetical protein